MMPAKALVLDANILLRAVFGAKVRAILESYEDAVAFYSPDVCFEDAQKYIPDIAARRNFDAAIGLALLDQVGRIVSVVDRSLYEDFEPQARAPIWTEDQDFFGTGVATWTSNRIEVFLRDS
jgi:predicted nucleic acid-binding protein